MKKKTICGILMAVALTMGLCGCGENGGSTTTTGETTAQETTTAVPDTDDTQDTSQKDTIGQMFVAAFNDSDKTSAAEMVDELMSKVKTPYDIEKTEAQEGWLNGFREDVKGFKSGVCFSPIVGSIPFVGYVFETDDPEGLLTFLKENANPAWNICTEADETVSATKGNLVLFVMCPYED